MFESAAKLLETRVDANIDLIQVGDDSGEPVSLRRDPGATLPGYIVDGAGTHFAYLSRTIRLGKMFHGADTGGVETNTAAWAAACAEIRAKGGGRIYVPAGRYAFDAGQVAFPMDCDLEIEFHPAARFAGKPGITSSLIRLKGAEGTARGDFRWQFHGVNIDMSQGAFAGNQPSGISPSNVRDIYGYGGHFYGGPGWEGSPTVGGDSGIEPINVGDFRWDGGRFHGWIDAGIYAGGGNDLGPADDGTRYAVSNALFIGCGQGITFKRAGTLLQASGNYFDLCSIGVTSADVGIGQEVRPGQRMEIHRNVFRKTTARAIGVRSDTLAHISGNLIEDWGYSGAGVLQPAAPAGRGAILFEGGVDGIVKDNVFRMKEWAESSHVGILVKGYTDANGTIWQAGRVSGDGNWFNCSQPVHEAAGFPGYYTNSRLHAAVGSPFTIRTGTVFEMTSNGNPSRIYYLGTNDVGVRTIEATP